MRRGFEWDRQYRHALAAAAGVAVACSGTAPPPGGGDGGHEQPASPLVSRHPPPSDPACLQGRIDHSVTPSTASYIYPRRPVRPFYQWENDNGYCGEVSLIQAGLNQGQWMSQLDARLICGAVGNGLDAPAGVPLSQSGPDGFCAANQGTPDYNAQLLLENEAAANATTCLANARLAHLTFESTSADVGLPGYRRFMSWIKAETIAGHAATLGVFVRFGGDEQYDHIVSVIAVGTNHPPSDPSYYEDDVLYFDDHGAITSPLLDYPAIPPGAGESQGCAPFVYGYAFGDLPKSREGADAGPNFYAVLIPGLQGTKTYTGGNGIDYGPPITGRNYAFSVTGPQDEGGSALPVVVRLVATETSGVPNPAAPLAGYDYESPFIGDSSQGFDCTNVAPAPMSVTLEVTVDGLETGGRYNLYEYDFQTHSGTGAAGALAVPTSRFNERASIASAVTRIVATSSTFVIRVTRSSLQTVVFRAVSADSP
jgi:hypothetical protein